MGKNIFGNSVTFLEIGVCGTPRGKQDDKMRFEILPQTATKYPDCRLKASAA
ncbi:MAG: hypothetical protein WAK43_09935 [Dehalococcoidales bacterium]